MLVLPGIPAIPAELTIEQRIRLVEDLSRRACKLDTLLRAVNERRRAMPNPACGEGMEAA